MVDKNWTKLLEDAYLESSACVSTRGAQLGVSSRGAGKMQSKEERLRDLHPGLQDLWEQYQTMLKLVDDGAEEASLEQERKYQMDMMKMIAGV